MNFPLFANGGPPLQITNDATNPMNVAIPTPDNTVAVAGSTNASTVNTSKDKDGSVATASNASHKRPVTAEKSLASSKASSDAIRLKGPSVGDSKSTSLASGIASKKL